MPQPLVPITPIAGRFASRSVLVTGAASGIGAATAVRFGAEGASVIVTDIDLAGCERVAAAIRGAGGTAQARLLDQASEESVTAFAASRGASGLDVAVVN